MGNNWKFRHVGLIVKDMDKVVEYFQSLGIISSMQPEFMSENLEDRMEYGKPADPKRKLRIRMIQIGSLGIELIQPAGGKSVHQDFLDSNGEGIDHVCFGSDNFEKERVELVDKGTPMIQNDKNLSRMVYFDTRKTGNIMIELINTKPK